MTGDPNDSLGNRIKGYEAVFDGGRLMPLVPAIVRLDGKCFHAFTRGLNRPFDLGLVDLMAAVSRECLAETNAALAYTQSDEITLVLYALAIGSGIYFDGRVQKIVSVLASFCSVAFNDLLPSYLPAKSGSRAVFDCRCFSVPNTAEAANALIWREKDAARNSVQMLGRAHFSHNELHKKNGSEIQEMLFSRKGVNWNDLEPRLKRGTYLQRHRVVRPFTADEIENLPPRHAARENPALTVERWEVRSLDMPPLTKVVNREAVVCEGADPESTPSASPR